MVGLTSYGFYVPKYRIKIEEIARVWGKDAADISGSLRVSEKAVASFDEDSLTMAYEASSMALHDVNIDKKEIKAVFFGSESPAYAVNPSSTTLAEFLGIEKHYLAYDTQFACKAATGATISALSLIKSEYTDYALVCASDKATAKTHDALEYTAGSGSVSLLLGKKDLIAEIIGMESFSSDTPDFWRREGIKSPSHAGRFTGKPSYFYHIGHMAGALLEKTKLKPADFTYAIFHMPNGRFPVEIASSLGFTKEQIEKSLVVSQLGNSYTASALMGLVATLQHAKKDDLIFFASYGSGAGSDGLILRVTDLLEKRKRNLQEKIDDKKYIDYSGYLKFMGYI